VFVVDERTGQALGMQLALVGVRINASHNVIVWRSVSFLIVDNVRVFVLKGLSRFLCVTSERRIM
jgi:hypothetical protein